jgi:hypothetical protein
LRPYARHASKGDVMAAVATIKHMNQTTNRIDANVDRLGDLLPPKFQRFLKGSEKCFSSEKCFRVLL